MGPYGLIRPQGMGMQGPQGGGGQIVPGAMGAGPAMDPRMMMAMMQMLRQRHGGAAPTALGMGAGPTGAYQHLYGGQAQGAGPAMPFMQHRRPQPGQAQGGYPPMGAGPAQSVQQYPNPVAPGQPGAPGGLGAQSPPPLPQNAHGSGGWDTQVAPPPRYNPPGEGVGLEMLFNLLQSSHMSEGQMQRMGNGRTPGGFHGAFLGLSPAQEQALVHLLGGSQHVGPGDGTADVPGGQLQGGRAAFIRAMIQAAQAHGGEGLQRQIPAPGYRMQAFSGR